MFDNKSEAEISVIICTLNRSTLLGDVLNSLEKQTVRKNYFEIILIDDGSTDDTKIIADQYRSKLPIKYFYQNNAGVASARNHGIFASSGNIILFLDDDDIVEADYLKQHLKTHEKYPEENFAVLGYTDWSDGLKITPLMKFIVEDGAFLFSYSNLRNGQVLGYKYFWGGRSSCKRNFLLKHGTFDYRFKFGYEDIELGFRLSKHNFQVVYNEKAISHMNRPVNFDDFIKRLYKQGRSQYVFSRLHDNPEIRKYTEIENCDKAWEKISSFYEAKLKSARELDGLANERIKKGFDIDDEFRRLLYNSYFWVFQATKLKGIIEQKNSNNIR